MFSRVLPLLFLLALPCAAQDTPPAAPAPPTNADWRLILTSKSLRTKLSTPVVEGGWAYITPAKLLLPGENGDSTTPEAFPYTPDEFSALGVDAAKFRQTALANTLPLLLAQEVKYFRDKAGLVEYAAMEGVDPSIAAFILLPEFHARFEPVFGARFRVVVPNQFTLYLFPITDHAVEQFARPIADQFRESIAPVSLEVFEISARGITQVGELPK